MTGDAHHLAHLAQREVLDVEEDADLLLARVERVERLAEGALGVAEHGRVLRPKALVAGLDQLDALDAALVVGRLGRRGVERPDVGADEVGAVGAQLLDADRQRVGELAIARLAAVDGAELARGLGDLAVEPADRPRRPVLAAQLVEHGAVDARPQELLERGALGGVVAIDRGDERLEPARDVVVGLLVGREPRGSCGRRCA